MKLIIDIEDDKVPFFMEMLGHFEFIKKADPISAYKAEVFSSISQAVVEMKEVANGIPLAREAQDFLDEL